MNLKVEELESFEALWDWKEFCDGFEAGAACLLNVATVGLT